MGVYVSLCLLGEGSLHPLTALWFLCMLDIGATSERPSERPSEGFSTGREGHGVGHRFLWVAAVVVNLEQDGKVDDDLQHAACPELHRSLGEQKVARFKGVATGPHQHHLDTVRKEGMQNKFK